MNFLKKARVMKNSHILSLKKAFLEKKAQKNHANY